MDLVVEMRSVLTWHVVMVACLSAVACIDDDAPTQWNPPVVSPSASQAADAARTGPLTRIVDGSNYEKLGFQSVEEARDPSRSNLGVPFPAQTVHIKRLRSFTPGSDARSVLVDLPMVYYPVLVKESSSFEIEGGGKLDQPDRFEMKLDPRRAIGVAAAVLPVPSPRPAVRTSIAMFKGAKNAGWSAVSYGATTWIQSLQEHRERLLRDEKLKPSDVFLVRAEPFRLDFSRVLGTESLAAHSSSEQRSVRAQSR